MGYKYQYCGREVEAISVKEAVSLLEEDFYPQVNITFLSVELPDSVLSLGGFQAVREVPKNLGGLKN